MSRPLFPFRLLRFWVGRIVTGWALIAGFIFLFQISVAGIVHDNQNVQAMLSFIKVLPPFMKTMLGGTYLTADNTAALLAIGHQHPLVLILFMVFAVGTPTSLLAGEVQRGTMELILSRSVTKSQVFLCAAIPTVVGMFLLTFILFLGTCAGTVVYHFDRTVPLYGFFKLAINGAFLASTVGSIAMLFATFTRERGLAVGLTVTYLVLDYFLNLIATWWPQMEFLRPYSLFHYVNGPKIFVEHEWPLSEMGVLATIATTALVLGWFIWRRRDLPA